MSKIHIEIEVDGEMSKTLAVLKAHGLSPDKAAHDAIAFFAQRRTIGKKIFANGGGNNGHI